MAPKGSHVETLEAGYNFNNLSGPVIITTSQSIRKRAAAFVTIIIIIIMNGFRIGFAVAVLLLLAVLPNRVCGFDSAVRGKGPLDKGKRLMRVRRIGHLCSLTRPLPRLPVLSIAAQTTIPIVAMVIIVT